MGVPYGPALAGGTPADIGGNAGVASAGDAGVGAPAPAAAGAPTGLAAAVTLDGARVSDDVDGAGPAVSSNFTANSPAGALSKITGTVNGVSIPGTKDAVSISQFPSGLSLVMELRSMSWMIRRWPGVLTLNVNFSPIQTGFNVSDSGFDVNFSVPSMATMYGSLVPLLSTPRRPLARMSVSRSVVMVTDHGGPEPGQVQYSNSSSRSCCPPLHDHGGGSAAHGPCVHESSVGAGIVCVRM